MSLERSVNAPYMPSKRRKGRDAEPLPLPTSDPLKLLLAQLLTTTRADMLKLRDKAHELIIAKMLASTSLDTLDRRLKEFTDLLVMCQEDAHWLYNPEQYSTGLPFDTVCEALQRDADAIREKTFDGLPQSLIQIIVSGSIPDWAAPQHA